MANGTGSAIRNRGKWPDSALRQLLTRIDEEFERRNQAQGTEPGASESAEEPENLAALEERLLREARRYLTNGQLIRG